MVWWIPSAQQITSTPLASSWITEFGSLAGHSTPIAYGFAGLVVVQRLFSMLKDWQRHRAWLNRERRQQFEREQVHQVVLDHLRIHLDRVDKAGRDARRWRPTVDTKGDG